MYGAIIGDIIGSRFEFTKKKISREFTLFSERDGFTDDTVMTVAIAEALMDAGKEASLEEIRKHCTEKMKKWGKKYPHAGYGKSFRNWLHTEDSEPYGSFGNGSAMRVSAAGWLYDSLERTREAARATADITHDHPEGIKGAECTAAAIYLARSGATKEEIREYVIREFDYPVDMDLSGIAKRKEHPVSCQDSVPKALVAFLEGTDYESTVRNAVCLGGDTDTVAAIAGSVAEAYYGIPLAILAQGKDYLEEELLEVARRFDKVLGRNAGWSDYAENRVIKEAIAELRRNGSNEKFIDALYTILIRMMDQGEVPVPMIDENQLMESIDLEQLKIGDSLTFDRDLRLVFAKLEDGQGGCWLPMFTDEDEMNRVAFSGIRINMQIETVLRAAMQIENVKGVVVNPFGQNLTLDAGLLEIMMERYESMQKEKNG